MLRKGAGKARKSAAYSMLRTLGGFGLDRFVSVLMVSTVTSRIGSTVQSGSLFPWAAAATLCTITLMVALSISPWGRKGILEGKRFITIAVVLAVAGLALFAVDPLAWAQSGPLLFAATLILGAGSVALFVRWGMVFSEAGSKTMLVEVATGYLLGFALSTACAPLTSWTLLAVTGAAAVIDGVVLVRLSEDAPDDPASRAAKADDTHRAFVKTCACLCCLGLAFGCLSQTLGMMLEPHLSSSGSVFKLVCGAIMVGAIALMATLTNGSPMAKAYKAAFLVIVLGCLAILATPDDPSTVAVMVFVGAMAIMVVGMALLFNLAHRAASPSPPIVACGAACFIGGDIAFRVIDRIVFSALPVTATPSFHFALLSALVVVTYAAVFTEHDLARVEKLEHVATNVAPDVGVHEVLGSWYGLTKREVEVLKYLVSGRSSRRIQEELFISESTVHTHIRHIYQKLGVHSKQELLDLADDVQRS